MAEEEAEVNLDWRKNPAEVKRIFDGDATDGFWTKETFVEFMGATNSALDDDQVEQEFAIADLSKNGTKLSYDDFYNYFVDWQAMEAESKEAVDIKGKLSSAAVSVRVRPLADAGGHAAGEEGDYTFDSFDEKENKITMSMRKRPNTFSFPKKVLCECTQKEMYDTLMPDFVNSFLLRQMNVMYLAYGQTGTGKTHTMFGPPESLDPEACPADGAHPEWGIFPRVVEYTLSTVGSAVETEAGSTLNWKIMLSAVEFYLGGAFDLLNKQVSVFMDDGRPTGITERECKTAKDMCVFLQEVYGNRHVRKTNMNAGSSRSHTALIIKAYFCDSKGGDFISNSFTLFDLAGAERQSKTGGKQLSPMEAFTAAMKGKDPGTGGEGAIINWDLTCIMNEVQSATDMAMKKKAYKLKTAMTTPGIQMIGSCFDGRAMMGMVVCMSQAPQHGGESWFSCTMGEKLAGLKSPVQPAKIKNIEKVIKETSDKLKKAEKSLKDKPGAKFAEQWKAQAAALKAELDIFEELKLYDPAKDQVSLFVRKKLGLFADLEGADEDSKVAKVRACFEEADANKDRVLSQEELKNVFFKLPNNNLSEVDIASLFNQIDVDKDGHVTFEEFFAYLFPNSK